MAPFSSLGMKETLCSGSIFAAVSLPRSCRACAGSSSLTDLSLSQLPGLLWFFLPHPPSLTLSLSQLPGLLWFFLAPMLVTYAIFGACAR